jgi:transposase InsO family protein
MSVRRAIVEADVSMMNVAEFCRTHRVSTWFFWDLRRRYAREGDLVLTPKSTAPHRVPSRTSPAVEDAIVAKRKELLEAGLDAGPATIRFHLDTLDGLPSESTIWRILVARGQVVAQPSKAPKSRRSFTATRANEVWALDDTDWALADGTGVKILNIIDDHSRLDIASQAMPACHGPNVLATMATAAQQHGWPERFWSDNARVFTHTLANAVQPLGVIASHTRPFSPNSNGKVERFHQTVKRWLNAQPRADTLDDLQHQHDNQRALTIITGNRCHIFVNGRLARTLTLDPTRRSQPLRTT